MIVSRFTCDILGPVPVGEVEVKARLARAGRSVELLEATLRADGRIAAVARAWRVLRTTGPPVAARFAPAPALPGPSRVTPHVKLPNGMAHGYLSAVEWRPVHGAFGEPGPATVWARLRHPLVPDEQTGPLERLLALADSASGVSGELPLDRWQFINPELSVHLHREAVGEWVCLDAATAISTGGAGLATAVLSDREGPVGVSAQTLLVTPRRL